MAHARTNRSKRSPWPSVERGRLDVLTESRHTTTLLMDPDDRSREIRYSPAGRNPGPGSDFRFSRQQRLHPARHRQEAGVLPRAGCRGGNPRLRALDGAFIGYGGSEEAPLGENRYRDEWGTVWEKTGFSWPSNAPVDHPLMKYTMRDPELPGRMSEIRLAQELAGGRAAVIGGCSHLPSLRRKHRFVPRRPAFDKLRWASPDPEDRGAVHEGRPREGRAAALPARER